MFTLFHLIELQGTALGIFLGAMAGGRRFGILGGLAGALVGGIIGRVCGRLPFRITGWVLFRDLRRKSPEALWAMLRDNECVMPNLVLLELRRRGEDRGEGLRLILGMLVSEDRPRRFLGWTALRSVFPDQAAHLDDYNPDASADLRRAVVARLEAASAS